MSRSVNVAEITLRGGSQADIRAEFRMGSFATMGLGVSDSYKEIRAM